MIKKNLPLFIFIVFILWSSTIFYFSSQPSEVSNSQSRTAVRIINKLNDIFDISATKIYIKIADTIKDAWPFNKYKTPNAMARKSAHFGIYFILGTITACFGYTYSGKMLIGFLLGVSLPVVVAVLDELNQGFVGRTSSLNDVIIDGAGALTGTSIVIFLIMVIKIVKMLRQYI